MSGRRVHLVRYRFSGLGASTGLSGCDFTWVRRLILLLAALGVSLTVVIALAAIVLSRRRWIGRQPGAFKGAIRVSAGEVDGLGHKWRKGYGRFVRDILVWTKGPFFFRNELVLADSAVARVAEPGEVKRLCKAPVVVELAVDSASVFVAVQAEARESALGPYVHRDRTAAEGLSSLTPGVPAPS